MVVPVRVAKEVMTTSDANDHESGALKRLNEYWASH